jgi:hypothetical protein
MSTLKGSGTFIGDDTVDEHYKFRTQEKYVILFVVLIATIYHNIK